mmetsp:Transcript_40/g.48  ORF Transcript_40/g.48 Transcript_40/m.48 type:complete len:92 (+) Transcript_40:232-507(+)|eukprot:CAMPEP_0196134720 /NCGR_PEP_ID=MMETSP0910-20130528/3555_1 /TAXON_ID=49265 /ORGANISM="Thalassiosira rotula, Strain GSO102" /LENGTH=91 /DNA_ID=CAMNT_0041394715 /DNA_START=262 /DNA_END=537 /DNA_ORIENTATION=+
MGNSNEKSENEQSPAVQNPHHPILGGQKLQNDFRLVAANNSDEHNNQSNPPTLSLRDLSLFAGRKVRKRKVQGTYTKCNLLNVLLTQRWRK